MATNAGITVTGVEELQRKLMGLPTKLRGKILRPIMREGTKTILAKAKELVPVAAGAHQLPGGKHLRDTLKVRVNPGKKRGEISFVVMTGTRAELGIPAKEKGYYPAALEYGGLHWQPMPYMRPAYRATRQNVTQTIRAKVLAAIEREASRK